MKTARQEQNLLFEAIRRYCNKRDIPYVLNAIESYTSVGFPDVFMMLHKENVTYNIFIEIKRGTDKLRVSQKKWWSKAKKCNILGFYLYVLKHNTVLVDVYDEVEYQIRKDNKNYIDETIEQLFNFIKKQFEARHVIRQDNFNSDGKRYQVPND